MRNTNSVARNYREPCWFDLHSLKAEMAGEESAAEGMELILDEDRRDASSTRGPEEDSRVDHTERALPHHDSTASAARRVQFDTTVQVFLTDLVQSCHPECTQGFALECGWEHLDTEYTVLTESSNDRRDEEQLRLSPKERLRRLQAHTGFELEGCALQLEDDDAVEVEWGL